MAYSLYLWHQNKFMILLKTANWHRHVGFAFVTSFFRVTKDGFARKPLRNHVINATSFPGSRSPQGAVRWETLGTRLLFMYRTSASRQAACFISLSRHSPFSTFIEYLCQQRMSLELSQDKKMQRSWTELFMLTPKLKNMRSITRHARKLHEHGPSRTMKKS